MISIPYGILFHTSFDASFVALCGLFIAIIFTGTFCISWILRKTLGISHIAGNIIGGIMLGPTGCDVANFFLFQRISSVVDPVSGDSFSFVVSDLSLFFVAVLTALFGVPYLLWLAGHETEVPRMIKAGFTACCAGVLGALLPIGMIASALYYYYPWSWVQAVGMGMVFSATSVSISVAMLLAYHAMHTRSAQAVLGAAIIDDIVAVILLSLFMISIGGGHHEVSLMQSIVNVLLVLMSMCVIGYWLVRPLVRIVCVHIPEWAATCATVVMLSYFVLSEMVGHLAGITGAYFAGLFHRMGDHDHKAVKAIEPFVSGLLLPLFLGSIGFQVDMRVLSVSDWIVVGVLLVISIISKFLGCFVAMGLSNLGSRSATQDRWSLQEAYLFGASMVARGEVGLVIATILLGEHLFTAQQYVICVVVIVLTTVATPLLLAPVLRRMNEII